MSPRAARSFGPCVVPHDSYFFLGDNRGASNVGDPGFGELLALWGAVVEGVAKMACQPEYTA